MAKAREIFAGYACKEKFDNGELFRTRKPFLSLGKGLRGDQFMWLLTELSPFKKYHTKKALYSSNQATKINKFNSVFYSSFRLIMPIILIEKQNKSQLVMHLGSREKCGKAN